MELRTNTGFSGINYLQCFVQSYCFINSKHKQTNDLFKYGILKDEFSGCDEVARYFENDTFIYGPKMSPRLRRMRTKKDLSLRETDGLRMPRK